MKIKKSNFIIGSIFALASLFYTLPYFLNLHNWGIRDWDLFSTISAVPLGTIQFYGQFPFWNPYLLGGNILFHHPEAAVLSPFILVNALFGVIVGLKIQVLLCYFLGLWGSYRFARSNEISSAGSVLASLAYFGSIHFALHFAEGHLPFTHFCFLPWFIYFVKTSADKSRRVVLASAALALMIIGNGAAVPLLYTATLSALYFLILSVERGDWLHLRNLIVAAFGGFLLSAVKMLPMVVYLVQNRWPGDPTESIPLSALGKIFFGLKHSLLTKNFPEQIWAWHEYGAYISPLLVLLALAALVYSFKRSKVWLMLALFFLLLGLGNFGKLSPWALLSHLPGFGSARATGRAFQFVILSFAILGGIGFDLVRERFKAVRWSSPAAYIVAAVIVATNLWLVWPVASEAFQRAPQFVFRSDVFEQVIEGSQTSYKNYLENKGSLVAPFLSAYHPSRGLVDAMGRVQKEHVQSGQATVSYREYTPNRIDYRLNVQQEGILVIGMGYDAGWSATDGRQVQDRGGLIAVPLKNGNDIFTLVYQTPFFYTGLLISLLSLIGAVYNFRRAA